MILEEFGPDIQHIKGEDNIVADAMSRLPTNNKDQSEPSTDVQGLSSKVLASMEMFALEEKETSPLDLSLVQKT